MARRSLDDAAEDLFGGIESDPEGMEEDVGSDGNLENLVDDRNSKSPVGSITPQFHFCQVPGCEFSVNTFFARTRMRSVYDTCVICDKKRMLEANADQHKRRNMVLHLRKLKNFNAVAYVRALARVDEFLGAQARERIQQTVEGLVKTRRV